MFQSSNEENHEELKLTDLQKKSMKRSGNFKAKLREKNDKTFIIDSNHGNSPFKQLSKIRYLFEKQEERINQKKNKNDKYK